MYTESLILVRTIKDRYHYHNKSEEKDRRAQSSSLEEKNQKEEVVPKSAI